MPQNLKQLELNMKNKEINKKLEWNLSPLFKNDNDQKIIIKRKKAIKESYKFINKWKNRHDYLTNPKILKIALDEYERWTMYYGANACENYYFELRSQQDKNNPLIKAALNKSNDLSIKIINDIQFFELNISRIPADLQRKILANENLKKYRHFIDKLFIKAKYLLSDKEEKILNLKVTPAYSNWKKMTSGFLAKETGEVMISKNKKVKKSFSEIISLLDSPDKIIRDSAAKSFNEILEKYSDVAEAEINSILANKRIDDELRGFKRSDKARHMSDDIETEIVDTMVNSVSNRFDIAKKYYTLKARLFKVKVLKYHERNIQYGKINKPYSFTQSIVLMEKVLQKINPQFNFIFQKFIKNGQFDVFPRQNKSNGAFCAHGTIDQPTYILLNFNNELRDVMVMAHESGHGINNELMKERQNALNFGTSVATAEVASTFMEDFVLQEISQQADEELQLAIKVMQLNNCVSTIFRQVACYRFEQELHKKFGENGYLSKKEIGEIFQKHMSSYMGKSVISSPGSENWWIYWGHIRSFFYVYSYASGLLISKSLQSIFKQNPDFIEKIKEFLSAGLFDSPKNIFKNLGLNISDDKFWNKGINEIEKLLEETTMLAKKLKKI